jgi:hypothetical protein
LVELIRNDELCFHSFLLEAFLALVAHDVSGINLLTFTFYEDTIAPATALTKFL